MNFGLSVYLNYEIEDINNVLNKCHEHGFEYVFTSLHIPENDISKDKDKFIKIINKCNEYNLKLIVDVSPRALKLFDIESFYELSKMGVKYLRCDFGFDIKQIIEISNIFTLILNASTVNNEYFESLISNGLNIDNIICCHNFYPKKYTGLSKDKVLNINNYLHSKGLKVIGFVAGDKDKRGPLYEGLPTIEAYRNDDVFYNYLSMYKKLNNDIVIVGDFDISDIELVKFDNYKNGFIELDCTLYHGYEEILNYIHHDRVDNSDYFIRSHESIYKFPIKTEIEPKNCIVRRIGDICISNKFYKRYNGEVEIMKTNLNNDDKVNVIGRVKDDKYLEFIDYNTGILLKKYDNIIK